MLSKPWSTRRDRRVGAAASSRLGYRRVKFFEGDTALESGDRGAEAVMEPERKRQVSVGAWAVSVEPVGLVEDGGITVRSADGDDDGSPACNRRALDLDVLGCGARGHLDGAVVAEQLLDGRREHGRLLAKSVPSLARREQRHGAVSDQIDRCLEAGDEEQQGRADELVGTQAVSFLLGRHRLFREQGYAATSLEQIAEGAEVTKGGIYGHFSTKEDLLLSAIEITPTPDYSGLLDDRSRPIRERLGEFGRVVAFDEATTDRAGLAVSLEFVAALLRNPEAFAALPLRRAGHTDSCGVRASLRALGRSVPRALIGPASNNPTGHGVWPYRAAECAAPSGRSRPLRGCG
jgi:AcrR family transcriptional regulator